MQNETKKHMQRALHPIKRSNKAVKNKTKDEKKKMNKKKLMMLCQFLICMVF